MPPFIAMPRVLARPPRRRKVDGRISIGRLVPEPASAVLPGLGTLLCDARRRRA